MVAFYEGEGAGAGAEGFTKEPASVYCIPKG